MVTQCKFLYNVVYSLGFILLRKSNQCMNSDFILLSHTTSFMLCNCVLQTIFSDFSDFFTRKYPILASSFGVWKSIIHRYVFPYKQMMSTLQMYGHMDRETCQLKYHFRYTVPKFAVLQFYYFNYQRKPTPSSGHFFQ